MLRRLLLALLIACLATPAVAMAGHCGPAPVAAAGQHGKAHHADEHGQHDGEGPASDGGAVNHDCIGCIAPLAAPGRPSAAVAHGLPPLSPADRRDSPATGFLPATPPPRS